MNRFSTDFLWAPSSFLKGMGSVIAINGYPHEYNVSANPDEIAISHDWHMVGQDLADVMRANPPDEIAKRSQGTAQKRAA